MYPIHSSGTFPSIRARDNTYPLHLEVSDQWQLPLFVLPLSSCAGRSCFELSCYQGSISNYIATITVKLPFVSPWESDLTVEIIFNKPWRRNSLSHSILTPLRSVQDGPVHFHQSEVGEHTLCIFKFQISGINHRIQNNFTSWAPTLCQHV